MTREGDARGAAARRWAWLGLCTVVLVGTVLHWRPTSEGDGWVPYVLFLGAMTVLALPTSLLVIALVVVPVPALERLLFGGFAPRWFEIMLVVAQWGCFVWAGYWQWFVVVPRSFQRRRPVP